MIETWNEYHEGTEIAASLEYGRQYIELNRKYVDLFRAGVRPPYPRGPYSDCKQVSVELRAENLDRGLAQVESADGVTAVATADGVECRRVVSTEHAGRYVYFRVDDSFKWSDSMWLDIEVEYFDAVAGGFRVEYDGSDTNAPFHGAYTSAPARVTLRGSRSWKTGRIRLSEARLHNSQNAGADFRLVVETPEFYLRRVAVIRFGVPAESGTEVPGFQQDFGEPWRDAWYAPEDQAMLPGLRDGFVQLTAVADAVHKARLGLPVPTMNEPACEVMMRLRLSRTPVPGKAAGGIEFAGPDRNGVSVQLGVLPDGTPGLVMADNAGMAGGPWVSVVWRANEWYWLRARHAPSAIFGYPDLLVRLWPADGETAEPEPWTGHWDYQPRLGFSAGPVGIRAPANSAQTELECDYFLLKAAGLNPVTVRLPASKPDRPVLGGASVSASAGFRFELEGRPHACYVVESSADLLSWASVLAVTDQAGKWQVQEPGFVGTGSAFFRARIHE